MNFIFNSHSIFYPPYITVAILITFLWLKFQLKLSARHSVLYIFKRDLWISKDILVDISFCIFFLLVVKRISDSLDEWIFPHLLNFLGNSSSNCTSCFWHMHTSTLIEGILATVVTMFFIDGASYFLHRWLHTNKFLWEFHSWHHSVKKLNIFSTYRQHPVESLVLSTGRICLYLFHFFFSDNTPVISIQGLGAGFFIYMFTVNLHHSHVPVQYPKLLRYFLVSPHIHHLHHSISPRHQGKNYGVVFSVFDRMLGTYYEESLELDELAFGVK
jgi:sterol desaturase/sphingolipid hydroxylase (fatty acid hydroxylase superfamily)